MKNTGNFYLVATPIGNLEDITLRALRILREVDLILCENHQNSAKLLKHHEIHTPNKNLYGFQQGEYPWILEKLKAGENIAFITDAGTPGISDPGSNLVRYLRSNSIEIQSIPGPNALGMILSLSGAQANPSIFLGFLPEKSGKKMNTLLKYANEECLVIYYESVHRIKKSLEITRNAFPGAEIIIGRELTKLHEELIFIRPKDEIPNFTEKGEFVVLINNHTKKIAKEVSEFTDTEI